MIKNFPIFVLAEKERKMESFFCKEIISEQDIKVAFEMYQSNTSYFYTVSKKTPSLEDVKNDKVSVPEGVSLHELQYGLYTDGTKNIGLIHLLRNYPDNGTVYIGLFLIHGAYHRKGYGKRLMEQIEESIRNTGYRKIRLGVVEENKAVMRFWENLGFSKIETVIGSSTSKQEWKVYVMEKDIC